MDDELGLQVGLILLLLLVNGLLSGSEVALISVRRARLLQLDADGEPDAAAALRLLRDPGRFLATIQVGITIAGFFAVAVGSVGFVVLTTDFLRSLSIEWLQQNANVVAVVIVTLVISFVSVVVGELVPKQLAIRYAEAITLAVARPLEWLSTALTPLVKLLNWASHGLLWVIGQRKAISEERPVVTEAELRLLFDVAATEGEVEQLEAKMLHRVFEFTDRLTKEVMTPRPEILWLDKTVTLADFLPQFEESYHARYPVCDDDPDQVLGIIYIKDVLKAMANTPNEPALLLSDLVRPAYFVPETKRVGELFEEMRAGGHQMAILVDEYGGTAGLVTLKQLTEEIVGRVGGEEAQDGDAEYHEIDARTVEVEGNARIDELNEALELGLPEGDYETVAGFILSSLGHIPTAGEQLRYENLRLQVDAMDGVKIEKVIITRT